MLYTIGNTEVYEKEFKKNPTPKKIGRDTNIQWLKEDHPNYEGGIIFLSKEEAQNCIDINCEGYSVYGVETTIENTYELTDKEGTYRYLINDSLLVKLCLK